MSLLHDRIALNQVRAQGCSMRDLSPLIANYQSNNCIKWLSVSLLRPHHIVRCQSPEEFSLVFPLNTVHVLDFSIFSSLSLLSGYGACVPTTPKVPAVPQHKLGTQASGAFSGEKSTSLPSLLPYKVLWHPVRGNTQRETRHTSALTLNPFFDVTFQVKTGGKNFISSWKRTTKKPIVVHKGVSSVKSSLLFFGPKMKSNPISKHVNDGRNVLEKVDRSLSEVCPPRYKQITTIPPQTAPLNTWLAG